MEEKCVDKLQLLHSLQWSPSFCHTTSSLCLSLCTQNTHVPKGKELVLFPCRRMTNKSSQWHRRAFTSTPTIVTGECQRLSSATEEPSGRIITCAMQPRGQGQIQCRDTQHGMMVPQNVYVGTLCAQVSCTHGARQLQTESMELS